MRQPVKTFVETFTARGNRPLHPPLALSDVLQSQLLCDLCSRKRLRQILLVAKDQQRCVREKRLIEKIVQFDLGLLDSCVIVGVNNINNATSVFVVKAPEFSDLVLATNIPHAKLQVLVLHGFDIEADGRCGLDNLSKFHLVQNGGLPGSIQAHHQYSDLLSGPPPRGEQLRDR